MNDESDTRTYRQTARAKAAEETGERILDAFQHLLAQGWFEEIRLEDVASHAGVSVQTVIRRFGGKEGLLESIHDKIGREIVSDRTPPTGQVGEAIVAIIAEYERLGDFVLRLLAQEDRYPPIRQVTDEGRAVHRRWTGELFEPWLSRLEGDARRQTHDRLVIALDLYVWKLLRRDVQRSCAELYRTMLAMCADALGTTSEMLERPLAPEKTNA